VKCASEPVLTVAQFRSAKIKAGAMLTSSWPDLERVRGLQGSVSNLNACLIIFFKVCQHFFFS
jgi:hypothetical protein